ncbi:glycine zipper 2TM domain-containing protein [soil metagenome]
MSAFRTINSKFSCAAVAVLLVAGALSGCATPRTSASDYSSRQVGREQVIRMATVESVRVVSIDRGQTGVGTVGGAVVGGVAGSAIGGGRGSFLTAVVGAIAGGIAGQAIEGGASRQEGLEITVRLDNGEMRAIVHASDEQFRPGERVRLLSGTGGTRVTH